MGDRQNRSSGLPGKSVSMALLFYGVPIRRLDHGTHPNPDRTKVTGIHKHRWHEELNQRWAYKPDEMRDERLLEQPDAVFRLFLEECGIELLGSYQPFLT